MEKPFWIEKLIEPAYQLITHHDPKTHLPFLAWGLQPYYSDLWLRKIFDMVRKFKEKGFLVEKNLRFFPTVSSLRLIVLINIFHNQNSKENFPNIIVEVQDFFVKAVIAKTKGNDFFANGTNIELTEEEIENLLKKRPLKATSIDESRELGKILVALASLTHGLYNDFCTDFNYEISGPYYHSEKMILLRSFPESRPKELWPEIDWDFNNFSIITEYKGIKARIELVGCHINYTDNVINHLTAFNFQMDGKEIFGLDELKKLREKLMPIAARQYEILLAMDFEQQKIKYLEQEHYQLKKLFELVGMDWRPNPEILERIKDKKLIEGIMSDYNLSKEQYMEQFGMNKLIKAYEQ